jgi:hypothetical protein
MERKKNIDYWMPLKLCMLLTPTYLMPPVNHMAMNQTADNNFIVDIGESHSEC